MKTCMRYLAVVFAVVMIVCSLSAVSAAFPDVASDNVHASAISTMTNLGILGGYEDGTFRPDNLVRRDEMAKIVFVTYTTYTDAGEGTLTFPDVPKNSWAKGYISWCAGKNIVGGYEDGTFKPEGNITYDEALKMVCAMLGYTDFKSDLWPVDVRTKGLIELKLGEGLEGITGDTALTRAQIVQLVYNSLDKPLYQEIEAADGPLSNIGAVTLKPVTSVKDAIWGVKEISAQIIGTENYGFIDLEKNIQGKKTEDEGTILVRLTYDDETTEDKLINLEDIGLSSYIGSSDDLLILYIDIIAQGDKYISCSLKGTRKNDITSGYASTDGVEYFTSGGSKFAKYGVKIEGVNYYNERFLNLRRLTYFEDFVLATNPHVDGTGKIVNEFKILYSWNTAHTRWNESTFSFTQGYHKIQNAIDADSDGWFDYFIIEFKELFRVKKITSKTIELEYLHANQNATWRPVPDYKDPATGTVLYEGLDLVFPKENVAVMSPLEEGMIIQGYQLGDTFTVTAEALIETGYCVKYDATNLKYTLDNGRTLGGDYTDWRVWDSDSYAPTMFSNFNKAMDPLIGIGASGNYNYAKYWTIEDKIIWMEPISAEEAGDAGNGYNKALLLYVTEPTEPQINEATKEHEIFYPAYLVINGRTILVNLNPDFAIDKFSAETIAQDGSPYRASVVNDNGINRVMYVNKLVTYSIDSNGYYTLYTDNDTMTDATTGDVIEMVVPADEKNVISIDQSTGIISIRNNGVTVQSKIILGANSLMYYPYTKDTTGVHEHIDYYRGSEIPADFEPTFVRSDIYLTYDEETGLYELGTLVLDSKLGGTSTVKSDWRKDAREHLYAILDTEAVAEDGEIYASYSFITLSTFDPLEGINKSLEYAAALKAEKNKIYAWDAVEKDYVEVTTLNCEALKTNEVVSDIYVDKKVVFTTSFGEGMKIDDTVKIVAVTDRETATIKAITFEDLVAVYDTIAQYNEDNEETVGFTPAKLTATIGTYTEDENTMIAYVLIDWVEYDAEENKLIIAEEIDE
ncbi:MAG: S-layer homology domain-containing protein [Ruminococcaceae bacterium]|nr:S-layer homology domain-containing protein [Oscillospiraceae bacterium]